MDSHASCLTPPLGSTMSISFNATDSDYRHPFHIQLQLLLNTNPTPATRLLYVQMVYFGSLSYTIPKIKEWRCNGKGYVAYRNFITRLENRMKLQPPSHLSSPGTRHDPEIDAVSLWGGLTALKKLTCVEDQNIRLSAVYGGSYMLNKPECKVEFEDGKAIGVTTEGETAKCKKVVCDPSYLPDKVKAVGKVARAICIVSHPIPHTNDAHSTQVILPQKQLGRKSDMYLFCCSYSHNVVPKGKFIAFVTTEAETDNPETVFNFSTGRLTDKIVLDNKVNLIFVGIHMSEDGDANK
ncbi:unnamed protein product [Lactuca virosa]|uniref:Guanosine nucleotide diphosphate dissociation inhibitor n=1 Tax=Lactuca virosa TaxID=75947 RepID=A0AAU9NSN4_9ASTR|nr:unnamed protein product [Lactuca virosa]